MVVASSVYGAEQTEGDTNYSGYFEGDVHVGGDLDVSGTIEGYATTSFVDALATDLDTHVNEANTAHGGIVASNDARLTDARTPTGKAGGVLGGTYPNPSFASDMATQAELDAHINDATAAHAATAIAFTPAGTISATTVQAAIEEVASEASGAPTNAEYIVETANGSLSNEVVLGTTVITTATQASRQAAAKAGRLFLPSNGYYIERDTGAAWAHWGPLFPMTPPVLANFTWVNQGGATAVDTNGGLRMTAPAVSGSNIRILKKSAPATPYTVTVALIPDIIGDFNSVGLLFRESSSGKCALFTLGSNTGPLKMGNSKFTNSTTYSADYSGVTVSPLPIPLFLRIADDGANRILSYSRDGVYFIAWHTIGRTDFLTADEVGLVVHSNSTTNASSGLFLSYVEA